MLTAPTDNASTGFVLGAKELRLPRLYHDMCSRRLLRPDLRPASEGTITIEFYVGLSPTNQNTISAIGGFQIVEGSGAYASLQGGGEIVVEVGRNAPPTALTQVLEGQAWFAQ